LANLGNHPSRYGLDQHGLRPARDVYWNLPPAALYEHALGNGEVELADNGAVVALTGKHTGRSPNDKFLVEEPSSRAHLAWGAVNRPISVEAYQRLRAKVVEHLSQRPLYVRDMYAGADPRHRIVARIVTETAWHNLFACQLFVRPQSGATAELTPDFTVLNGPSLQADPATDGTRSPVFIVLNFAERTVLIGGTAYAGEIKKSIFTVMNYVLPRRGVLSMHCSANTDGDDVALFFGLSGTGKTTLSADPRRRLIGDDEHGWGDDGVFNIEGGCYAKCIRLSPEYEPQIYKAIRFGTVLENVVMDPLTRQIDYNSERITENTRAAYPLEYIDNAVLPSVGRHPRHILFLTCDAFGVLPPIAKLTPAQTMYHFLCGYTAKVAGTEAGVTEPQTVFSTCFGAPFLPLPPTVYANMLGEKLKRHGVDCWLVNTGWSGGGVGVGKRINLRYTRAMVSAALDGALSKGEFRPDPVFNIAVPGSVPGVPAELLTPRKTWPDSQAYDRKARELAQRFAEKIKTFDTADPEIRSAGPKL
jgi:phosphoenolpyruvate carboxykinase (ATP)